MASLPPLASTVKSSLFRHAHSSPLPLAARLHQCCTNCSCYINNGCIFSGQTSCINNTIKWDPIKIWLFSCSKQCTNVPSFIRAPGTAGWKRQVNWFCKWMWITSNLCSSSEPLLYSLVSQNDNLIKKHFWRSLSLMWQSFYTAFSSFKES